MILIGSLVEITNNIDDVHDDDHHHNNHNDNTDNHFDNHDDNDKIQPWTEELYWAS